MGSTRGMSLRIRNPPGGPSDRSDDEYEEEEQPESSDSEPGFERLFLTHASFTSSDSRIDSD